MLSDQFSEEGEEGKIGASPRKLPKSGKTPMFILDIDCNI